MTQSEKPSTRSGGEPAVTWTSSRDKAAKERGELVDAWWNQNTRRWERPLPHMFKDPLLSSLIHLKPPGVVYDPTTKRPPPRQQSVTLDGVKVSDAWRQRTQGTR